MCAAIAGAVGNWLEVIECIETLNGNGPDDLEELVVVQSAQMLLQSGVANSRAEGILMCKEVRCCPSGWHTSCLASSTRCASWCW
eukprot:COSAG02_NODE_1661_length_11445_cov_70.751983_4_plen_85_part_00